MTQLIPYPGIDNLRVMIFADGENLAIRYGALLAKHNISLGVQSWYLPNVYVWAPELSYPGHGGGVVRKYFYTSIQGDEPLVSDVAARLKNEGIEAPRVFKKSKGSRTKQVDISLAVEMLTHATRKHFDIAVLIAGDQDYVPLVRAVQGEGCRVHLWFFQDGLSPALEQAADHFFNLEEILVGRASRVSKAA
jgi:uncharacterized LabA/DUF88 family protein